MKLTFEGGQPLTKKCLAIAGSPSAGTEAGLEGISCLQA